MLSPRIPHIDLLRGIAIFFVVLGHINSTPSVVEFIYGFHIPLFFFISGILFQPQRFENTRRFVLSRFKALGLPYIVLAFLTLLYWIVVERAVRAPEIPIWTQFLGILYGSFHLRYLAFNIVLWFIPCLLSTEILYWYLQRYIPTLWYGVLFILFATLIFLFPEKAALLPWGIGQAGIAISFYALGHQTRHFWIKKPPKKNQHRTTRNTSIIIAIAALQSGQSWRYVFPLSLGLLSYSALRNILYFAYCSILEAKSLYGVFREKLSRNYGISWPSLSNTPLSNSSVFPSLYHRDTRESTIFYPPHAIVHRSTNSFHYALESLLSTFSSSIFTFFLFSLALSELRFHVQSSPTSPTTTLKFPHHFLRHAVATPFVSAARSL